MRSVVVPVDSTARTKLLELEKPLFFSYSINPLSRSIVVKCLLCSPSISDFGSFNYGSRVKNRAFLGFCSVPAFNIPGEDLSVWLCFSLDSTCRLVFSDRCFSCFSRFERRAESVNTQQYLNCCKGMEKISGLPDDLLVKILSFVPTKVAASTSVLSKRWKCLWMWVPTLEYDDFQDIYSSMPSFLRYRVSVHKNLLSHRAPTIETLRLKFCLGSFQPDDIKLWVSIAVSRCVRELSIICFSNGDEPDCALPSSLYTCKTLVTLKLEGDFENWVLCYYSCVQSEYGAGIIFDQLEHLKMSIRSNYWSKLLFRLLKDSPSLRVLNLKVAVSFFISLTLSLGLKRTLYGGCNLNSLSLSFLVSTFWGIQTD